LSLGHLAWAFLGWQLRRDAVDDITYFTLTKDQGLANIALSLFVDCCALLRL
jgi:hypothetical protein